MPRYFLHLPEDGVAREWDPRRRSGLERKDTLYWGGAFETMEPLLQDGAIDVYLTFDRQRLPRYGHDVVAVLLGDEIGSIPRYVDRVRAVFRCYGRKPTLGSGPLRNPGLTGLAELAQYSVRWIRWLPGGAAYARSAVRSVVRAQRPARSLFTVPVGTFNQLELPIEPIENRPTDLFFAGSTEHAATLTQRILSPKVRSRREMLTAVERLAQSHPQLNVDLQLTRDFKGSESASASEYSRAMMGARVCLAPRGTAVETFRLLEGLRYGCVVVSPRLPSRWYFRDIPVIQIDRWRDLEAAVIPVLGDPVALHSAHERALAWWHDTCSEAAVGRFLADRLNDHSSPHPRSGAVS